MRCEIARVAKKIHSLKELLALARGSAGNKRLVLAGADSEER